MIQPSTIEEAAAALLRGEAVVFPTDTVYGLGVSVKAADSPQILYDLKQRDPGKPIAWLVGGIDALDEYGRDVPFYAREAAQAHWPGPLTLVVCASEKVPAAFRSEMGTIALRMPDNPTALALIKMTGAPIATTSANVSGGKAYASFCDISDGLLARVGAAVCDDTEKSGIASVVLDCTGDQPRVIR